MNSWLFEKLYISGWRRREARFDKYVISIHYIPRSFAWTHYLCWPGWLFLYCGNLALAIFCDFSNYFWVCWSLARWNWQKRRRFTSLIGKVAIVQGQVWRILTDKIAAGSRLGNLWWIMKIAGQIWVTTQIKTQLSAVISKVMGKMTAGFGAFSASVYRASAEIPFRWCGGGSSVIGLRGEFVPRSRVWICASWDFYWA